MEFSTPDGEVIFTVPAPFMVDAAGAYSEEIVVCLTRLDADICELVYIPDYALGLKESPPLSMSYGESVSSVASRVMNYVQNTLGRSIRQISGPTASINSNEYRFCMRVGSHANKMDYHFWLHSTTGAWTDNHVTTAVSDEPIFANPSTANWDLGGYTNFYDSDTIYFAATLH